MCSLHPLYNADETIKRIQRLEEERRESKSSYFRGSTLSLLLDSFDMTIQDIQVDIESIGRFDKLLIRNPMFSDDELEVQE